MKPFKGKAKVGKDNKIHIPKELKEALDISAGDTLHFTEMSCGIVVTKNGVP
jgi:AbrB family looped-hinge helix DNA binding protein